MPSLLERIRNSLLMQFADPLAEAISQRIEAANLSRNYRIGRQPLPLKIGRDGSDDNIILNYIGLAVDRSISMLFGKGVEFDLPGETETPQDEYINEVWRLNNKAILLHRLAMFGAEQGTVVVQLIPDGYYSSRLGRYVPRIAAVDPALMTIETEPNDYENIVRYTMQYIITGLDGKDRGRKQVAQKQYDLANNAYWVISDYELDQSGRWVQVAQYDWSYPFAPYIHWQNLPSVDDVYGQPDIGANIIRLQNQINFIASNIAKIIRYHAHPKTIGKNVGEIKFTDSSPDQFWRINGENAEIYNLEMQSDLASSLNYLEMLRQSLFASMRSVDITSMPEKIGGLTNFGLRVIYQDALQKLATKRELYGMGLTHVNKALLTLGGFGYDPDPGEIVWSDPLPSNAIEETQSIKTDLELGLVSKQTVSNRRGYNWAVEQERISAERADEDNIGAAILRAFNTGQG